MTRPVGFAIGFSLGLVPGSLFMLGFAIYGIAHGLGGGDGEVIGGLCLLGLAIASALIALGWRSFQDRRRSSPP